MKNLIMLAAIAALLTVSACKKAETVEAEEVKQETTEQAAAAVSTAAETAAPVATETKAE